MSARQIFAAFASSVAAIFAACAIAAEPVVAPEGLLGFRPTLVQKALGEPTTSGTFNGDIPVDYFAEHGLSALYDQMYASVNIFGHPRTQPRA